MSDELIVRPEYEVGQLADAGSGSEDITADTLSLPYVKLIQPLSPEVDPAEAEYLADVRPGMFINGATGRIYGKSIDIVAARFVQRVNEWAPRNQGGGLRGVYSPKDAPTDAQEVLDGTRKRMLRPNGNFLETSYYYYVLVDAAGKGMEDYDFGVLPFKSTGLKVAKKFNATILAQTMRDEQGKKVTKAIFSQIYNVTTLRQENAQGVWHGTTISRVSEVDPDSNLYHTARAFRETCLGRRLQDEKVSEEVVVERETNF